MMGELERITRDALVAGLEPVDLATAVHAELGLADGRVLSQGALRSCAVHGRNFWLAYGSRSFGGRFFCPGYLRDDLFRGFDPQPYRPPVLGQREGDHTVRMIDGGWPTADTPMVVLARRGDLLVVRPLGMPDAPAREVPLAACWPHRYVAPSRNACWS